MKTLLKPLVLTILTWEAKRVLAKWKPAIVAVVGSVGKTSTKDLASAVLASKFSVRKSEKSLNSDFGVPLAILGLESAWGSAIGWLQNLWKGYQAGNAESYAELLVLEVGADHPDDIAKILTWLRPHHAIVTSFPDAPVHAEFFSTREKLWDEDALVMKAVPKDGHIVLNGDDRNITAYLKDATGIVTTYGIDEKRTTFHAGFPRVVKDGVMPTGMNFSLEYKSQAFPVNIPHILGPQLCYSALAAIAIGERLGVNMLTAIDAVRGAELPKGRMRILAGKNGSTLIDDTYNSSPIAAEAAIVAITSTEPNGKTILILGDMRELGSASKGEHERIGALAGNTGNVVIGVGALARDLVESAKGKKAATVEWCATAEEAGNRAAKMVEMGDIVLVKGSQGVRMERCSALLLRDQADAKYLPRQESAWKDR